MDEELRAAAELRAMIEAEPFPRNLPAFVDACAAELGDAPAANFFEAGVTLSYRELAAKTRAIAAGLAARGIGFGDRVGVMLPNIAAFPLTWLALARLGAIMVPINVRYTPREVAYVLTDSGAETIVIEASGLAEIGAAPEVRDLAAFAKPIVVGGTDGSWEALAATPAEDFVPAREPELDDLVNIQYTSGTTGFPKGCMLSHRYWLTLARVAAMRANGIVRNVLAAQPFYYMDPQWLLLMAMRLKGTLFVATKASGTHFLDWVRRYGIEYCIFPQIVLKQPPRPDDRDIPLKIVAVFGLRKDMHAELEQRFDVVARESFGMTEVGSALFTPYGATSMVGSGTCGIPSPFREATIRDEEGREVPPGEIGELWIRGPGILQGYWNKPEANAESFREGGWFRTGDLFRRDERGFHYIVGRIKDMIRRSGENIAAREVEAVMLGWHEVLEAAAIPVPDPDRGQEVLACLVLKPGITKDQFDLEGFFEHCTQHLAPFKVPRFLEIRKNLPKTPSEKIAKHVIIAEREDLRAGVYDRLTHNLQPA
ncbi:AMP-binding protein [Microvirga sp. BT688]|uniref:class I adenylate-forming enzyme family protein n=1 Tax=Microvirga sp. TaxID=1873136 RepID=UPI001682F95A|nr:AMP-binding protein [Microvirga sp.]MBD2749190.1 AMP-binding protein [Microvirga sp.]